MEDYLSDEFLDRVKAAYRRAVGTAPATHGQWATHNERRADVHAALTSNSNDALRAIFTDPTTTDLYYGVDRLCRSQIRLNNPSEFIVEALNDNDPRARSAAYQVKRLLELNANARTIVEIGPGMGRTAYHGHLAGLDYTTIDLPLGVVAQACFLGRALGPHALSFQGENEFSSDRQIKLLYSAPDKHFDMALNVDSMTEMPAPVAFDYFRWAAGHVHCLLSINRGDNPFTVAQLAAFSAPNKILVRRPCPGWDGYVEEAFLTSGVGTLPRHWRLAAFKMSALTRRVARGIGRRLIEPTRHRLIGR